MGWGDFSPYRHSEQKAWKNPEPWRPFPAARDYAVGASARILAWAAGRSDAVEVEVSAPAETIGTADTEGTVLTAEVSPAEQAEAVTWRLRNVAGGVLKSETIDPARAGRVEFALPSLAAGRYLVDAIALADGAKVGWDSAVITVGSDLRVQTVGLNKGSYRPFEGVSGTVEIESELDEPRRGHLLVQLIDAEGRLVDVVDGETEFSPGASHHPFSLSAGPADLTKHTVRALLRTNGRTVDIGSAWCTFADRTREGKGFHAFALAARGRVSNTHYLRYLRRKGMTAINRETAWDRALEAGMRVFTGFHTIRNDSVRLKDVIRGTRRYSPIGHLYSDEAPLPPEKLARMKSIISTHDRGARGGHSGVSMYAPWRSESRDAPGFVSNIDFFLCYAPSGIFQTNFWMGAGRKVIRSFIAEDAIWGPWTGYVGWRDNEPWARIQPWTTLFEGGNMIALFTQYGGGSKFIHQMPDGSLTQEGRWYLEEVRNLQDGIARQVQAVPKVPARVAILWPENRTKEAYGWTQSLNGFCFALEDLGWSYDFVSGEDLREKKFIDRGYEVLILPQCVQWRDARSLSRFAKSGGLVVADTRLGIQNDEGEFVDTAKLDKLFGIRRHRPEAEAAEHFYLHSRIPVTVNGVKSAEPAGADYEALSGESGLSVTDGEALAAYTHVAGEGGGTPWVEDFADSPAIVRRRHGSGAFVYLNFGLRSEVATKPNENALEQHKRFRRINRGLLDSLYEGTENGRVTRPGGDPLPYTQSYAFGEDGLSLYGVVQQTFLNCPDRVHTDKSTARYYLHGSQEYEPNPARVRFPGAGHVYDVRSGQYLGHTDSIQTQITPGRAELYAVLDYRVYGVSISAPDSVMAGEPFRIATHLEADGAVGPHAVRVSWERPDGKPAPERRRILCGGGGAGGWMQFALNDAPGRWRVKVSDVISGKSAEKTIRLRRRDLPKGAMELPVTPGTRVERKPFSFDPLRGGLSPGNTWALERLTHNPQPEISPDPRVRLKGPFIKGSHWRTWFPGLGWYKVNQVWQATLSRGPVSYRIQWVGNRDKDATESSAAPVNDSAVGMEGPAKENWLGWTKQGFLSIRLGERDLRDVAAVPEKLGDGRLAIRWDCEEARIRLRLSTRKGTEALLARLEIQAKEEIEDPVIVLHNRAGGVGPVGEFWYAATARRDNALGSALQLPEENWVLYADRAMNRAHGKGHGTSALLLRPDAEQIQGVRLAVRGEEPEPTHRNRGMKRRQWVKMRWHHMIDTTIELAPVRKGALRTLDFALWEWSDRGNSEARGWLEERAEKVLDMLE
jgi:hypothetical protein